MLWNLDFVWLLLAVTVVSILGFLLSLGLDAIMGSEGFGAFGNMIVVVAGFFLGILVVNWFGIRLADLRLAALTGVGGAFACLFALAAIKGAVSRL